MSGIFVEGRRQTLPFFLQKTRIRKIRLNLLRKLIDTNLETQKQTKWMKMHQSQVNMCFLRGPPTEQKNPKLLRSLQNAQHDTTNLAVKFFSFILEKIDTPESFIVLFFIRKYSTVIYIEGWRLNPLSIAK